jgi:hypothetical protein
MQCNTSNASTDGLPRALNLSEITVFGVRNTSLQLSLSSLTLTEQKLKSSSEPDEVLASLENNESFGFIRK